MDVNVVQILYFIFCYKGLVDAWEQIQGND
jgi:hypothetical protein